MYLLLLSSISIYCAISILKSRKNILQYTLAIGHCVTVCMVCGRETSHEESFCELTSTGIITIIIHGNPVLRQCRQCEKKTAQFFSSDTVYFEYIAIHYYISILGNATVSQYQYSTKADKYIAIYFCTPLIKTGQCSADLWGTPAYPVL